MTIDPQQLAACITRDSASNLWFVGQALMPRKRRLFEAAYASMRIIDDFVDDDFLTAGPDERAARRDSAQRYIDLWRDAAVGSIADRAAVDGLSARDTQVMAALRQAARSTDLPDFPWHRLAEAMAFDVAEGTLETWDDFARYCDGATVAPAIVFLYVLQAHPEDGEGLRAGLSATALTDQARDMAVFCYLVHIMRDFAKDAARGGQLVTIPEVCFAEHGTNREALSTAPERATALLGDLSARAERRRVAARAMADSLIPSLAPVEGRILNALLSIYERLHDSLKSDPSPLRNREPLIATLRATLASQLGLALP